MTGEDRLWEPVVLVVLELKLKTAVEHVEALAENFSHANTSNYVLFRSNRRPQMQLGKKFFSHAHLTAVESSENVPEEHERWHIMKQIDKNTNICLKSTTNTTIYLLF